MLLKGFIREAELQENPPGSDQVEMIIRVQGVSPGQPRTLIVPFTLLVERPELDPEEITGRSFAADVASEGPGRWVIRELTLAGRILRDG